MKFSIGAQFSREISAYNYLASTINKLLNDALVDKSYHTRIQKIYCGFLCVSKDFEPFFVPRPLRIYKKEDAIEYEIKIDFNIFINANEDEKLEILKNAFIERTNEVFAGNKLKDFNKVEYTEDIKRVLLG